MVQNECVYANVEQKLRSHRRQVLYKTTEIKQIQKSFCESFILDWIKICSDMSIHTVHHNQMMIYY